MIIQAPVVCKPCLESLCTHNTFLNSCLEVEQKITYIFKSSATEGDTVTCPSDLFIKNEDSDKDGSKMNDMEVAIKSECLDIKSEGDEEWSETLVNRDCRDAEEDLKHAWKHNNRSSSITESERKALLSNSKCVDIKLEEVEGSDTSSLNLKEEPVDCTSEWQPESVTTSNQVIQMYKCDSCDYKACRKEYLGRHQLTHKYFPKKIHKCHSCEYKTSHKKSLRWHELKHKKQMYKCGSCNYETVYKSYFTKHQLRHTDKGEIYQCYLCDYKTSKKRYMVRHQLVHKNIPKEQMYKCDACAYKTSHKQYLRLHEKIHKDVPKEQTYKCYSCEYRTGQKRYLRQHELRHKNIPKGQMHRCDLCNYKTVYKTYFTKHRLGHKEKKMYQCYWCEYTTSQKKYFAIHQLVHEYVPKGQMHTRN